MPLEGVSSSFFGITCWYRAVTPVTIIANGSTKCFTRPAENITALRKVTKLSATHPGVFGRTVILKVANEHHHTCSTFANTLSKLRPASFLMSSSVHVGSSNKVANSCGYLETSSKPVGVLQKNYTAFLYGSNDPHTTRRNPIAFGVYVFMRRGELTRFLSTSSGTFLVELHSALAALCEKITGALVVCRAALIVLVETCERSTNMPSLFNSLTTACGIMKCIYASKRECLINESEGNQSISEKQAKKRGSHAKYRKNMQTKSQTERDAGWMMLSIVGNACRWCLQGLTEGRSKKRAILLPGLVDYRNFVVKCSPASSNNTFVPLNLEIPYVTRSRTLLYTSVNDKWQNLTLRIEFFFGRPVSFINIKFSRCKGCELMVECRATPSAVIKRKLFWKHNIKHTLKTDSFLFIFEEAHSRSVGSSANAIENPIILHGQFSLPDVETLGDDSASSSRTVENSIGFDNLASPRRRGKTER
ncbi:hypothetical protein G5I_14322 [Acromyrmex echinatior]|uniref:Uncharacterized protein n=1 Tax=Acromyrmex echinatior TaxID=103372 RepID=F4X7E7_ACREC|nr:hypothetical protein G5I_14322 [Acromyrmex echinatior]